MLEEAVNAYPQGDFRVYVVWMPMLASDNENAARHLSSMFADPRVMQFYDSQRLIGAAYSRDMFRPSLQGAIDALPAEHFLRGILAKHQSSEPERHPVWDAAMFYPKNVEWSATAPQTDSWCKQLMFFGARGDGITGTFWVDTMKRAPVESDWFAEVRTHVTELLHEKRKSGQPDPKRDSAAASDSPAPPEKSHIADKNKTDTAADPSTITSLGESLDALRDRFNSHKGRYRFVALLSPT